jgi:hypothetical protein
MATKEEIQLKSKRLENARVAVEQFVAAGGDLKSSEAVPLGVEMIHAFNDLSTEFGNQILKKIDKK